MVKIRILPKAQNGITYNWKPQNWEDASLRPFESNGSQLNNFKFPAGDPRNDSVIAHMGNEEDLYNEQYQTDPNFAKGYDNNLFNHTYNTGSRQDIKSYNKFYNNKYGTDFKTPLMAPKTAEKFTNFAEGYDKFMSAATPFVNYFEQRKQQKDFNKYLRTQMLPDNMYTPIPKDMSGNRGNFFNGKFRPNEMGHINEGRQQGFFAGNIMAYGGQSDFGLDVGSRKVFADMPEGKQDTVSNILQPVPEEEANIEAEKGETVYGDLDGDGALEHSKVGGKRHSEGGTPLNVPQGSFVFSDTKKMTIKDPEVLKQFGMSERKGGYTPAEIAKRYDINKYKAIMEDENADVLAKSTAQLMIKNFEKKLGQLSLIQEEMKGFPQGVPDVAKEQVAGTAQVEQAPEEAQEIPEEEMAYGGELPKAQAGIQIPAPAVGQTKFDDQGLEQFVWDGSAWVPPAQFKAGQAATPPKIKIKVPSDVAFTPEFQKILSDLNASHKITTSPRMIAGDNSIPITQHKQNNGLFGDVQTGELDEFKQRNKWYFNSRPDWNPSNSQDILDFQTRYDNEYAKKYGFAYFPGGRSFDKKDGKLGEYTYNAPGLDEGPASIPMPPVKVSAPPTVPGYPVQPNPLGAGINKATPFGYLTPDNWALTAAASAYPNKYLPYQAKRAYNPGSVVYEDFAGPAAAQQAGYNEMVGALGTYQPGNALMSNSSQVAGQSGQRVADIISGTNSRNVITANAFDEKEKARQNTYGEYSANRATNLFTGNAVANQQYDNAFRTYINNLTKAKTNRWNNRMNLGMINAVNPLYNVDPRTGYSYFKGGYGTNRFTNAPTSSNWEGINQAYQVASQTIPGLTLDQFIKLQGKMKPSAPAYSGANSWLNAIGALNPGTTYPNVGDDE